MLESLVTKERDKAAALKFIKKALERHGRPKFEEHLAAFLDACNFAKRRKTLRGLTPYEAICKAWAEEPNRFKLDPVHLTSGLNT